MSESTLSVTFEDIRAAVGSFVGYVDAVADWSAAEAAKVDRYIQAGYRQFLYPPEIKGRNKAGYEWSFLRPTATIDTIPRYATGSIAVVSGTCTITDGVWPSWAYTDGTLMLDGTKYVISSRDSDTELTVVGDDVEVDEDDWYLSHVGYQELPQDLGRVVGGFFFEANVSSISIPLISEHRMRILLQQSIDVGRPQFAAIRSKVSTGTGQRKEVMWWPIPNDIYTMTYRYEAYQGKLITTEYPLGGMKFSEVILASCLAMAEQRTEKEHGVNWEYFVDSLVSAIAYDRENGASIYGSMSPSSSDCSTSRCCRLVGSNSSITYKGKLI